MKQKIFYLHGFNSGPHQSDKTKALEKFGEVKLLEYDTFSDRESILQSLVDQASSSIEDWFDEDPVFIGTSLGGYYAASLGKHFCCPSVLLNPATDPYKTLKAHEGQPLTNYISNEEKTLGSAAV